MDMQGKKILIIDDHPIMHRELEKVLAKEGFQFTGAFEAMGGLRKAKEESPDLILLDVMLPEYDGKQVVRSLKSDPETKDIPIIFMTVTLSKKDDVFDKTIEVEGVAYPAFPKPLNYPKVIGLMKELISAREKPIA